MAILRSPFHICARCGTKQRLQDMVWQKGLLVCIPMGCVDNLAVEQRPQQIAEVLASGPDAQVDPKLVQDFDSIDETAPF